MSFIIPTLLELGSDVFVDAIGAGLENGLASTQTTSTRVL